MEQRVILFLVLSIVIVFSYPYFLSMMGVPPDKPTQKQEVPKEAKTIPNKDVRQKEIVMETAIEPAGKLEKVIETDLYRVVLSNVGGTIKKWELKKYTYKNEKGEERPIQLIKETSKTLPITVIEYGNTTDSIGIYKMDASPLILNKDKPEAIVEMDYVSPKGQNIKKILKFHNNQYLIDIDIERDGGDTDYRLSLGTNFGIHEWGKEFVGSIGAISMIEGELVKDVPSDLNGTLTHTGTPNWLALHDKYFISAIIPKPNNENKLGPVSVRKEGENLLEVTVKIPKKTSFSIYAGPKEYDRLASLKVYLEESIDFGWFIAGSWLPVRLVAKPLFYVLQGLYKISHNYGVAIILLTILVKVIFFPLTRKSLASMKAMSAMQPKVAAIRKQWEKNKEKMNKELMNLYKEEGINPLSGCLPMLMQLPVFISLFNVLYVTIELRQAPFMFWIHDLSDKDPYYVLPIIMGISMFFQQLTQPNTMDPIQAKIMLFMPVIYTFFFLNFPSGLVLYWLINNILSIGQQYYINKEGLNLQKA